MMSNSPEKWILAQKRLFFRKGWEVDAGMGWERLGDGAGRLVVTPRKEASSSSGGSSSGGSSGSSNGSYSCYSSSFSSSSCSSFSLQAAKMATEQSSSLGC